MSNESTVEAGRVCRLGEPMMHGPQPYRWCEVHERLMLACDQEFSQPPIENIPICRDCGQKGHETCLELGGRASKTSKANNECCPKCNDPDFVFEQGCLHCGWALSDQVESLPRICQRGVDGSEGCGHPARSYSNVQYASCAVIGNRLCAHECDFSLSPPIDAGKVDTVPCDCPVDGECANECVTCQYDHQGSAVHASDVPDVVEPPARVWIVRDGQDFDEEWYDEKAAECANTVEYLAADPIRKALEACETDDAWETGHKIQVEARFVAMPKSQWKNLVDVIKQASKEE